MKCEQCGRELREDSQFCDKCGSKAPEKRVIQEIESKFNYRALALGIFFSILITLLVTGTAQSFGIPLFFGGFFLPFFWWKIKKTKK